MKNEHLDPTNENYDNSEIAVEKALRPKMLDDFSGQKKLVDNLKVFIEAAKMREEALDHVLLHGPPGLGKTTLANIIARATGSVFDILYFHYRYRSFWGNTCCRPLPITIQHDIAEY